MFYITQYVLKEICGIVLRAWGEEGSNLDLTLEHLGSNRGQLVGENHIGKWISINHRVPHYLHLAFEFSVHIFVIYLTF